MNVHKLPFDRFSNLVLTFASKAGGCPSEPLMCSTVG